MSIINVNLNEDGRFDSATPMESAMGTKLTPQNMGKLWKPSDYVPTQAEREMRAMIIRHFTLGYTTMYTPRVEFNDLSVLQRQQIDQMSWNTYQSNNGDAAWGDAQSWKSRAIRPVVRNKCVSIAAHATARLIFPKVFAYAKDSEEQTHAAQVMTDLMEWAADQSNYEMTSLRRTITALTDPASIGYTEYCEVYRNVKRPKEGGGYEIKTELDETLSGFQDTVVPVDELFIENFFEPDIQKQGWLIWRRVYSYSLAESKYKTSKNWEHVVPGVQVLYNDANQAFYQVYDTNMRPYDVEEVIYFNRSLDVKVIMVNGVMMTEPDNPNPRNDKLYPFDKFGYEMINNRCFYYKSLAFKLDPDARIINTLYPMIIDGTYLNIMPPMIAQGDEEIGTSVIVPGAVTSFSNPNSSLTALKMQSDTRNGMEAMARVDDSLNVTTADPIDKQGAGGTPTAYEISRVEQNAATVLGLFVKMISQHVRDFGKLRMGDILQYLTIPQVEKIEDDPELVYKTFMLHNKTSRKGTRRINFDMTLPDGPISKEEAMKLSYETLQMQGGPESRNEIYRVNPSIFRDLKYMATVDADVLNPHSDELERAFDLETYDRLINNPSADQEEALKLLLSTNPKTRRHPEKYVAKQNAPMGPQDQIEQAMGGAMGGQPGPGQASAPAKRGQPGKQSPMAAIMGRGLPQPGAMR